MELRRLTLTGLGTYTVSVTGGSSTSSPSNTDTFVVCYTEGPACFGSCCGIIANCGRRAQGDTGEFDVAGSFGAVPFNVWSSDSVSRFDSRTPLAERAGRFAAGAL